MSSASRVLTMVASAALLIPVCGFAPNMARSSDAKIGADVIVTAAPAYEPLAALRGAERFPKGAQLLIVHEGKTEPLIMGFAASADANVSFANFYGNWSGRTALPRHRLCTLTFELRESHAADRPYAGYSSLTCTPFWPFEPGRHKPDPATVFMALKPMSAILSGAPEGGSILFHVDKTLGDNCPMTGLTLTPFGIKQIAVQWEDTLCGGGYMVLSKVR